MKNVIIPIHVTHAADMDGVGCALLTKYVFDNDTITQVNPYTGQTMDTMWAQALIIPVGNNVTDIMEEIEKLRSNKKSKQLLYEFESFVKDYGKCTFSNKKNRRIIFLYIFTDINLPVDTFAKLQEYTSNLISYNDNEEYTHYDYYSAFWEFDHHKTNPKYREILSYNNDSCIEDLYSEHGYSEWFGIPAYASIVSSYMNLGYEFQPFLKCVYPTIKYNHNNLSESYITENRASISDMLHLLKMDGNSLSRAERSATYFYFMFLYNLRVFDQCKYKYICRLIHSVFHISNYDTFEFAKKNPEIPEDFKVNQPDKFTIYFKQICNGDFFITLENLHSRITSSYDDIPAGNDFFPFDKSDNILIDYEYEKRDNEFKSMVYKSFVITGKEFCTEMGIEIKNSGLRVADNVAIITYPVNDPSYVGNSIVENYDVRMVVMLYPDSRIVSFRSNNKEDKPVDCSIIAKRLGGGGHMFSSGCKLGEGNAIRLLRLGWEPNVRQHKNLYIDNNLCMAEEES